MGGALQLLDSWWASDGDLLLSRCQCLGQALLYGARHTLGTGFVWPESRNSLCLAYYGILRGNPIQAQARDRRDQDLSVQLGAANFVTSSREWVGWRYLHDLGLPDFCVTKGEDVLLLNEDNRNPNHPLAHRLASLLWDLFERHREALEDLNANSP